MIKRILLNGFSVFILFNITILILYLMRLSSYYEIRPVFLFYFISLLLYFFVLSLVLYKGRNIDTIDLKRVINISNPKLFRRIIILVFLIGTIASIFQIIVYGTPLELENKVNRPIGSHYVQYLVNLLMISASMSYIYFRKVKEKRFLLLILFLASLSLLSVWLNRGSFTFPLLTIMYFEFLNSINNKKFFRFMFLSIILFFLFIHFFGVVGDARLEYVFNNIYTYSINTHYGMDQKYSSAFVQIYMYLTSPLENMSQIFYNQTVDQYSLGINMVYPFLAPFLKLLNIEPSTSLYPPLESVAGLNVSTFLLDSFTDFGFIGGFVYLTYLAILLKKAQVNLKKDIFGFLLYVSTINIAFWMLFTNAFKIGPFLINYFLFLLIGKWYRRRDVKGLPSNK